MLKYYPAESLIHASNARLKIVFLFAITLAALALPFETAFLLFPLAIALFVIGKIPLRQAGWTTIAIAGAFVFLVRAFFESGTTQVDGLVLSKGVYTGILNALYLAGVFLLVELLVKTTKTQEMRDALVYFRLPKRFAFMLTIALQAIPLMQAKMLKTRIAQASRGGGKKLVPLATPLLHSLFERAKKLSIALEARGFNVERL